MINLSKVFNKLKQAQNITHYWHLNTTGYAEHLALGAFYDAIEGLADSLAEKVIAKTGETIPVPPAIMLNVEGDPKSYFTELGYFIDAQIKITENEMDIQDVLLDIRNLINQTLYMLRLS